MVIFSCLWIVLILSRSWRNHFLFSWILNRRSKKKFFLDLLKLQNWEYFLCYICISLNIVLKIIRVKITYLLFIGRSLSEKRFKSLSLHTRKHVSCSLRESEKQSLLTPRTKQNSQINPFGEIPCTFGVILKQAVSYEGLVSPLGLPALCKMNHFWQFL